MNRSILSRVLSILFVAYALGYGAFLLYSVVTFSGERALPAFQWQYQSRQAFVLFVDYLVAIHVSGIVIALSLGGPAARARAHAEPSRSFSKLASSTLAAFIVLTIGFTAVFEVFAPAARARLADIEYESRLAREFLVLARSSAKNGDYSEAGAYAGLYLRIDTANQEVLSLKQDWDSRTLAVKPAAAGGASTAATAPASGDDATSLMQKATYYFSKEDYYSAHYFASQAHALEPGRTDALRLEAQAMEKITAMAPSREDTEATNLYKRKKQAYDTLTRGDTLAAYYAFLDLSKKYPKDKDIAEYLAVSGAQVQAASFFTDQAEKALPLPGTQSIVFRNAQDKDSVEVVAIGKLVETMDGVFAVDVEAVRYSPSGAVSYHYTARYGKLQGNTLLLHAVDRADPAVQFFPVYSTGSRPPVERNFLTLAPTVSEMTVLTLGRGGAPLLNLPTLWNLRSKLQGYGLSGQAVSSEILMDALMPFVFLTLSFLAMAFGWGFRARYLARPPLPLFIFVPLVPLVAVIASSMWIYAHKVLLGFVLLAAGLGAALAACVIAELGLLIVSLVLLAGQSAA